MRFIAGLVLVLLAGCGPDEQPPQAVSAPVQPVVQRAAVEVRTVRVPLLIEVTGQVTAVTQATLSREPCKGSGSVKGTASLKAKR